MTTIEKVARRKLSLLELATDMQNVSKACRIMGYSRQQFYEIRRTYQVHGAAGLADRVPGPRGPHPNRVADDVEKAVLDHCLEQPTQGCLRVAQELALKGWVSPDIPDTFDNVEGHIGGVRWNARDMQRSSSERQ